MLLDRILESGDAFECKEPDPEGEDVVLVESLLEERVVRAPVHVSVDALVEVDQGALVGLVVDLLELGEELVDHRSVRVRRALRCETRRGRLERVPHLGEAGEVTNVDARDEHPASGIHLDEALARERAQCLPHRGASQLEPSMRSRSLTSDPGGSSSVTMSSRMR